MVVHRPKIGVSTEQERGVELDRMREEQHAIDRQRRINQLAYEFEKSGLEFKTNAPEGSSLDAVVRDLERQIATHKQTRQNDFLRTSAANPAFRALPEIEQENILLEQRVREIGGNRIIPAIGAGFGESAIRSKNEALQRQIADLEGTTRTGETRAERLAQRPQFGGGAIFPAAAAVERAGGSQEQAINAGFFGLASKPPIAGIPEDTIQNLPRVVRPLVRAAEATVSPASLAGGVAGPAALIGKAGGTGKGAAAARFLADTPGRALTVEAGANLTAEITAEAGGGTAAQIAAGVAGGLAGAAGPARIARQFRPPKSAGLVAEIDPVASAASKKLANALRETKFLREGVEQARSAELSKRAGRVKSIQEDLSLNPDQRLAQVRAAQRGELPTGTFDLGEEVLTPDEFLSMRQAINASDLSPFDKPNLEEALLKVMGADFSTEGTKITGRGTLPTIGEIENLGAFFGDDFAEALLKHRKLGDKAWTAFVDAVNLPRTMLASFGIDALRQGAPLIAAHPKASFRSFGAAWRAARSDKVARQILADLERDADVALLKVGGLDLTRFGRTASQISREESFISRWGQIFPWVRVSERANVAFFNTLRAEVGKGTLREWRYADALAKRSGVAAKHLTPDNTKALANFINIATGRGSLGPLQRQAPVLNAIFFSPRLIASRFQLPFTALTRSPAVRKEIARDLAIFATTNIGILAFLKASSDKVDVELDPRSSDFGQLKIGPQRVDFWGGMRQIAVLGARIATGETKTTGTETILSQEIKDTILQFFRFKLSPQASVLTDYVTGETALGEELGISNQVADRLFPLVVEDMTEAFEHQGIAGAAVSSFSLIGLNSNTFLTTQDIVNPLLETSINVQAQDGTGRITDITDSRLTPVQRSQVLSRPDVQEALLAQSRRTKQDQLQTERNARRNQRLLNDVRLVNGEIDGRVWRNQLLTSRLIAAAVSDTRQQLSGGRPTSRPRNDNERALQAYYELVDAHEVSADEINLASIDPNNLTPQDRERIAQGFDVDGFANSVDQFLGSLSDEQRQFVLDNTHADRTPVENLYYEAQEVLKEYWDVPDQVIKNPAERAVYDQWLSMAPNARREFERRQRGLQRYIRRIDVERERMRKRSRDLDDMLIAFYSGAATHRANIREARAGFKISETRNRIFADAEARLEKKVGVS